MLADTRSGAQFQQPWRFIDDEDIDRVNGSALTQVLIYQRVQYLSNARNTVTANCPKLIKELFKLYLSRVPIVLQNVGQTIDHTIRFLSNERSRVHAYAPFLVYLRQVAYPNRNVNIERGHFNIRKDNWSDFVIPLIRVQNALNDHGLKSFTVVPLYDLARHHIVIDTQALYAIYNSNRHQKIPLINRSNKPLVWGRAFDLTKFQHRRFQFHHMIRSNGVAFSYVFEKPNLNADDEIEFGGIDFDSESYDDSDWEMIQGGVVGTSGEVAEDDQEAQDSFFRDNPNFTFIQADYARGKFQKVGAIDWGKNISLLQIF